MGAHAEAVGNRLELLLLFVNAVAGSPPPGLVHKRTVRGVHQADNAVINTARKVGGQISSFVLVRKCRNGGYFRRRLFAARETGSCRTWVGNKNPNEAVALFARKIAGVNAIDF